MRKILNIILLFCGFSASAQTGFDGFLQEVLRNNSSLKAYQAVTDAQKLENRLGLAPADPSVEGAYLWGDPSGIGNRKDFSVTQEIEFPTVYARQRKLASIRDEQAELEYRRLRFELLYQAAGLWVELVYLNRKGEELQNRLSEATRLARAYEEKFSVGDVNLIDRNKAVLYQLQAEKQAEQLRQDRKQVLLQLTALNGDRDLSFDETGWLPVRLPENVEAWIEQVTAANPQTQWWILTQQAGKESEKLSRAKRMPGLTGGYMMEQTAAEKFQGITFGLTVPLWEKNNTVRAARAQQEAAALQEQDYRLQWRSYLTQVYARADDAFKLVRSYREQLNRIGQKELLDEALQAGQISLIDYLLEIQFNYAAIDQLLDAEKQLQTAYVSMVVWEKQ
ncbi:TolC family protein [Gaoshiqia sp. Z1-71]|uniref:TolC family protein n=1 Tax=Gaoshiqia hydrogeniformans TaxID=3290090 RepID=UPI003BF82A98